MFGDADRELELRVLDTGDEDNDWRRSINQPVAQLASQHGKTKLLILECSAEQY